MGLGGDQSVPKEYTCQLPEDIKKIALEELREDDNIREQSLNQMREWINKHPAIKRCRTGKYSFRFFRIKVTKLLLFRCPLPSSFPTHQKV